MTQREIADELGLTGYRPVHELLKRERKKKMPGIPKAKEDKKRKTAARNCRE